jgi:hypothetical protein
LRIRRLRRDGSCRCGSLPTGWFGGSQLPCGHHDGSENPVGPWHEPARQTSPRGPSLRVTRPSYAGSPIDHPQLPFEPMRKTRVRGPWPESLSQAGNRQRAAGSGALSVGDQLRDFVMVAPRELTPGGRVARREGPPRLGLAGGPVPRANRMIALLAMAAWKLAPDKPSRGEAPAVTGPARPESADRRNQNKTRPEQMKRPPTVRWRALWSK